MQHVFELHVSSGPGCWHFDDDYCCGLRRAIFDMGWCWYEFIGLADQRVREDEFGNDETIDEGSDRHKKQYVFRRRGDHRPPAAATWQQVGVFRWG